MRLRGTEDRCRVQRARDRSVVGPRRWRRYRLADNRQDDKGGEDAGSRGQDAKQTPVLEQNASIHVWM